MTPRVALVHEWLTRWGGAESVLRSIARVLPDAPLYTSVWAPDRRVVETFGHRDVRTSFLQGVPGKGRYYRYMLPLMPAAYRSLDLSGFDLVVSSSHAFAKSVRAPDGAPHVCYCYTPPRYVWDFVEEDRGGLGRLLLRGPVLRWLRAKDLEAAAGVTHFVADCENVRGRIVGTYGRETALVYPPVDIPPLLPDAERGSHFVAGGRLVGYKRIDLAVEAANRTGLPLVVFGDGPELPALRRLAGPTVTFAGEVGNRELLELLATARAYLFPGEEDFGILPLEAQGVGTPVIALGRGGVLETVIPGRTGVFFEEQTVEALEREMRRLDPSAFDRRACRENAERFARPEFERRFAACLSGLVGVEISAPPPAG